MRDDDRERTPPDEQPGPDAPADGAPLGGDETTEEQLTADNAVEEDTLRMLDPDDTPA